MNEMMLTALLCLAPAIEAVPPNVWDIAEDLAALERGMQGCEEHFGAEAPCLKRIVKTGPLTYQVTCGLPQPKPN